MPEYVRKIGKEEQKKRIKSTNHSILPEQFRFQIPAISAKGNPFHQLSMQTDANANSTMFTKFLNKIYKTGFKFWRVGQEKKQTTNNTLIH